MDNITTTSETSTPKSKPFSWRTRALLMLGGIAAAVFLLEIVARIAGWLPTPPPESFFHLRQFVGPLPDPYETIRYSAPGDEFNIPVRFNYRSLRDIDHEYTPPPDSTRIMFLGDSFTAGWQVQAEQNYVAQLRTWLDNASQSNFDLINAGFHGWGTDRQYLFYREEGYKYQSDLVVLQIYAGNDVFDNGVKVLGWGEHDQLLPGFTLDASGALVYVPFTGRLPDPYTPPDDGNITSGLRWFLDRNSFTYRLARNALRPNAASETLAVSNTAGGVPLDMGVYSRSSSQQSEWIAAWDVTFALIRALRSEVQAKGGQFGVVLVRSRWETDPPSWAAAVARYNLDSQYDPVYPSERFREFLDTEGIPYLDLGVPIREYQQTTDRLVAFPLDAHWTAEGHCVAAVAIHDWLLDEALTTTPASSTPTDVVAHCRSRE